MQRHIFTALATTLAFMLMLSVAVRADAQQLKITVENLNPAEGFFLTPMWFGLHDGSFDLFEPGAAASAGLELIAEDGDPSTLQGEFAAPGRLQGVVFGPGGFGSMAGQPPVIDAGETASATIDLINPAAYPYFSFASMVIPSNDAFIGNNNPIGYELFNAMGEFIGPTTIEIHGDMIWDSGTEVNNTAGAAFSEFGMDMATDEGGTVMAHPGLSNFEGVGTPVGTIGAGLAPGANDLVARITITQIPEPVSLALVALGAIGLASARRRE
ncbi:Spondin [Pseudobythopirellula maris]|uniref:Spondin n=1 Tax=Pseudobythopirellula maris TaxID=2527991 RepID=A0A5C5ZNR9_9BACT|nr:spondin domain-containing protein [Pseudobythopirellula maris]TWT88776.1 Spondin [Pseudobythopirellula maris]